MTSQQLKETYAKLKSVPAGKKTDKKKQQQVPMKKSEKPAAVKASEPSKRYYQPAAPKATQSTKRSCCGR
jgi:hypothetical protein